MVKQKLWSHASLSLLTFFLLTCSSQPQKHAGSEKPEITIQVGSLNLANYNKRIERNEVRKLASLLKKEQVEIFAVQGITRYPGVDTRVDFVDELAKLADINSAFGEMINNSGRQTGNAVFSSYPIRSKVNQPFDNVKSAKFEAAVQAVIDGGTRALYVVSTQLPSKASVEDQMSCVALISSLHKSEKNEAVILAGNLPSSIHVLRGSPYQKVVEAGAKDIGTNMLLMANDALKVSSVRTIDTDFGPMLVVQFDLFREKLP
ncbi:MAG TPA: hypothetical protein VI704_08555 [Bacteroidota bacterium]|nr:hypothetical protein [Bacteroidota bacterium]